MARWLRSLPAAFGAAVMLALGIAAWLGGTASLPGMASRAHAAAPPETPEQQVTLAWEDADGQTRAGTIAKDKLEAFVERQSDAVARERYQARIEATDQLDSEMKAIFAVIRHRVPHYADWYYRYPTKYVLMSRALRIGLQHVVQDQSAQPHPSDFIHTIETKLSEYLQREFARQVLLPAWTEEQVETAYSKMLEKVRARWGAFDKNQKKQLAEFLQQQAKPVAAATAIGAGRSDRPPPPPMLEAQRHEEVKDVYAFRQGLLQIKVQRPRMAPSTSAPAAKEGEEDANEGQDKVAQAILDLFNAIVTPVASRVGDLVIGVTAGGVAGAMAGGSTLQMAGMAGAATGAATVAPVAAVFGGLVTIGTDFAASKFEERLTRPSFEENITQIVITTEDSVEKTLIGLLDQHLDALQSDSKANSAIDRLVMTQ